jgi:CHAT domain-containing protein
MAEVDLTCVKDKGSKKWLRLYFRHPKSSQKYDEQLFFSPTQRRKARKFITAMDESSAKCSKYLREKDRRQAATIRKNAKRTIEKYGLSLFTALKKTQNVPIRSFEDMFGEEYGSVTLTLDEITRRFPWELAHDGTCFLCSKYSIGRTVLMSQGAERISGFSPLNDKALVVGLNYGWLDDDYQLETPENEALQVERRLRKLGYDPIVLRRDDATIKNVKKALSEGVSVFHFSGHGNCYNNQPTGKKGRLVLRDGELTEEDLRQCFRKAKGAPYFSFLNACRSAKELYDSHLMDSFLDYGAENFVGNLWSVYDYPSRKMCVNFYDELVKGNTFGEALLYSRWLCNNSRKNVDITTWPALILYGQPNNVLPTAP